MRNDIGRFNEAWVVAMADDAPADVLEHFRSRVAGRTEALAATTDESWEAVGFTPAGQDTYGRFMRIRVFDCWLHEQDIRDAVGRPGGEDGPAATRRPRRDQPGSWATSSARGPARRRGRGCASS